VGYLVPQVIVAATVFIAMAWFPIPITNRAVNVMGKKCVLLRLHCECDVAATDRSGFLKHLFDITFSR